jgi:hypothetical protein
MSSPDRDVQDHPDDVLTLATVPAGTMIRFPIVQSHAGISLWQRIAVDDGPIPTPSRRSKPDPYRDGETGVID